MKYLDSGLREPSQTLASWFDSIIKQGEICEFRLQTGFFSLSGMGLLVPLVEQCRDQDFPTTILIGSNDADTLKDDVLGLIDLLDLKRKNSKLGVVSFTGAYFHPKAYYIKRTDGSQAAFVGSSNLTKAGLSIHVEAGISLDTRDGDSEEELNEISLAIENWFTESRDGLIPVSSEETVNDLVENGVISISRPVHTKTDVDERPIKNKKNILSRLNSLYKLPVLKSLKSSASAVITTTSQAKLKTNTKESSIFLMTLMKTDVGVGQTSKGTSRRSPEIFIPLAARDANKEFWGWPSLFTDDAAIEGKKDRQSVTMRIGKDLISVNMMTWPAKHDFRLRSEHLRSAGNIGDIFYMEKTDDNSDFSYYVEIIPQDSVRHKEYLDQCVNNVRNSQRKWGYI